MCDLKLGKETNAFCNKALKIVGEEKEEHKWHSLLGRSDWYLIQLPQPIVWNVK
jgi:hypothetical protein